MQTQQKLFTNRMLLTLLWPLVVEQALNVLVGMSDTVMVSSVGEAAISGVSLVDMINYLIQIFLPRWPPAARLSPASSWEPKSQGKPPAARGSWLL